MNFGDIIEKNAFRKVYIKVYYDDKDVPICDILSCFEFSEHAADKSKLIIDIIK